MISKKNPEGYYDLTAYHALTKVEKDEHKRLKEDLKKVCEKHGYSLKDPVLVIDNRSGEVYKL